MDSNMGFSDEAMESAYEWNDGVRQASLLFQKEITTLNRKVRDLESQLYISDFKAEVAKDELERVNSLWFNKVYNFFYTLRFRNPLYWKGT